MKSANVMNGMNGMNGAVDSRGSGIDEPDIRDLKTSEDIEAWNAGKVPIALIHPMSAGHGLNIQAGGHILIWFGLTWSLELYQQTNARLWRKVSARSLRSTILSQKIPWMLTYLQP